MKQSVIVISALFAAVEANANVADAKARMERDIRGYLHEGIEFEFKNIKSATKMIKRDQKTKNKWNNEVRQNIEETHVVLDEFKSALEYEKSQIVQTEVPSANNFNWGKIEINNNQQIVDNYMETAAHGKDLSHEWAKDATAYGNAIHKSHAKMGKDVMANWKDNGVKATNFAKSGI